MQKILIVDDDRDLCFLLDRFLSRNGLAVSVCYTGQQAFEYLSNSEPDVIISDLELGDINGIAILAKVKELYCNLPVIIITAHADIKTSALALKQGAFDYVMKPLLPEQLLLTLQQALETKKRGSGTTANYHFDDNDLKEYYFWGDNEESKKLVGQVHLVAPTNLSLIIYGESGVGKRSLAQEIHKLSKRNHLPFVAMNAAGFVKTNIASAIFGCESHEADRNDEMGILDQVNGGTLFIADPEHLPKEIQEKLLNSLQQRAWVREGNGKKINMDIRLLISSHTPLWEATRTNDFSELLYHRLNQFNITMTPLRARKQEIPSLSKHFLMMNNENLGTFVKGITPEAMDALQRHDWFDNVRELKSTIQKAALQCQGNSIGIECLPAEIAHTERLVAKSACED